jgi:adenosylmethionine-8-amino-7-oxononanoate aminotransferase
MVYPMGGTIDGKHGDHVLLAPPFIVTDAELDQIVERLAGAVDAVLGATARTVRPAAAPAGQPVAEQVDEQ